MILAVKTVTGVAFGSAVAISVIARGATNPAQSQLNGREHSRPAQRTTANGI
jgi:hypothetical protein